MITKILAATAAIALLTAGLGRNVCDAAQNPANEIMGSLVIVGGAENSPDIVEKFVELAGGRNARFGIVPAASGSLDSAREVRNDLVAAGVRADNVVILPLSKHAFSEATATENAALRGKENDKDTVTLIRGLNGIWFVGGDQMRIVQALRNKDGSDSKALNAIWEIYRKGAVLGGTSAGAAIMSEQMIANGDSVIALENGTAVIGNFDDDEKYANVVVTRGLGFFRWGMTDQHYDKRSRLGRTIVAALDAGDGKKWAFGIDENTAMVVNNRTRQFSILGSGYVTCINLQQAVKKGKAPDVAISGVSFSLLDKGDSFDLAAMKPLVDSKKIRLTAPEKYSDTIELDTGALSPDNKLKEFIFKLLDSDCREARSYCFDRDGIGFEISFIRAAATAGYCGDRDGLADYAATDVQVAFVPIRVKIEYVPVAVGG